MSKKWLVELHLACHVGALAVQRRLSFRPERQPATHQEASR